MAYLPGRPTVGAGGRTVPARTGSRSRPCRARGSRGRLGRGSWAGRGGGTCRSRRTCRCRFAGNTRTPSPPKKITGDVNGESFADAKDQTETDQDVRCCKEQ